MFNYEYHDTQDQVREYIRQCEGRHVQQAIYSTFHDALTQVCFGCRIIRTTILIAIRDERDNPELMTEIIRKGA